MTLKELLKRTGVDIENNKCFLGNQLDAELSRRGIKIDFNKEISAVKDDELIEIGRILFLSDNNDKHFFTHDFLEKMKKLIENHKSI